MDLRDITVLVVDDSESMRLLLYEILRALGVGRVLRAVDGTAALPMLEDEAIDLILTDLAMEPMDGITFIKAVRGRPNRLAFTPIIVVSGHSSRRRVEEARDAGANLFLSKPVTAVTVAARLTEAVHDDRQYLRTGAYFGPDRRRGTSPNHPGPWRRTTDKVSID